MSGNAVNASVMTFLLLVLAAQLLPPSAIVPYASSNEGSGSDVLVVVDLEAQELVVRRAGHEIARSAVSTGKTGFETPTGRFRVLEKRINHVSSLYSGAVMPFMQRLTMDGVALHAGAVPGYPASRGCIRLPRAFARYLFTVTRPGTEVHVI